MTDLQEQLVQRAVERARTALAEDPNAAFGLAKEATELATALQAQRPWIEALRVQAQARLLQGRHAESLEYALLATQAAQALGDPLLTAQVQIAQVDILGWLNRPEEAFSLGERLVSTFKALGAYTDAAKVLVNVGILHYRRDAYTSALACYDEASQIFAEQGDSLAQGRTLVNQANAFTALHRTGDAVALFEQALSIFQAAGQPIFIATVEINLGHLCYLQGQYSRALRLLESASAVFVEIDDQEGAAQCDLDRGDVYRALNLVPEALSCYESAHESFQAMEAPYDAARAALGRVAVLVGAGRLDEAEPALLEVQAAFTQLSNPIRLAQTELLRSELAWSQGRRDVALQSAQRAARVFAKQGVDALVAEARFGPARAALEAGQSTARELLKILRVAQRTNRGWLESRVERTLGHYYLQRGQVRQGLRHLRQSVAVLEQARTQVLPEDHHTAFLQDKLGAYEDLVVALVGRGRPDDLAEALQVLEQAKSRLLLERLQAVLTESPTYASLSPLRAQLSAQYHHLVEEESKSNTRIPGTIGGTREALRGLELQYQEALRRLQQDLPQRHPVSLPRVASLQEVLPETEVIVEFYIAQRGLGAFILTDRRLHHVALTASREDIERELRRFRFQLQKVAVGGAYYERYQKGLLVEVQQVLGRLYQMLWKPLAHLIVTPSVTIIPHGLLHSLPFHLLYDGAGYLLDRHCLAYSLSASLWHRTRAEATSPVSPAQGSALLMGAPGSLPHTPRELELLQSIFPQAVPLVGTQATLSAFRQHAPEASWIHLATHGLYRADNPLFSSLQFADGWLMASDLYQMELSATLVTLSACRTALSQVQPGDEVFGLLRGFFAAGARSVIASQWAVDDRATAELMALFYRHLTGRGKAAGLQAAQRQLRALYPHPYFWGAFLLMGSRD